MLGIGRPVCLTVNVSFDVSLVESREEYSLYLLLNNYPGFRTLGILLSLAIGPVINKLLLRLERELRR